MNHVMEVDCRELTVGSAETELGPVGVALAEGRICAVTFARRGRRDAERRAHSVAQAALDSRRCTLVGAARGSLPLDELLERLTRYAGGEPDELLDLPLLLGDMTPFQRRVIAACRAIPYGSTRTYGQLAASAGSPGAARAVGQVMAANRIPLIVPCHRVVAAGGGLGGFSAPAGVALKQRLLAMEMSAAELALG